MSVRTIKAALGTVVMTGALGIGIAGPASAVPAYCSVADYGSNGATGYCYASASGTQFRAVVTCHYTTPSGSVDSNNWHGPWRIQGDPLWSNVSCGAGWSRFSKTVQTG